MLDRVSRLAAACLLLVGCAGATAQKPSPRPDAAVAWIVPLGEVCPAPRTDALCAELRHASTPETPRDEAREAFERARQQVARRVARDRRSAIRDPAVRYFLRERVTARLIWLALGAPHPLPSDWEAQASRELKHLLPAYGSEPTGFRMARVGLTSPPVACSDEAILLVFPGVVRILHRNEFSSQMALLTREMPCLRAERVDTRSFVTPAENAAIGCKALEKWGGEPGHEVAVHLLGYSQGARNALQTLVTCPEAARHVRSVVTLNSAAHGSPLGDLLDMLLSGQRWPWPLFCLNDVALALGVPTQRRDLRQWLEAEGATADLASFLDSRYAGIQSLSTYAAREFWTSHDGARALPPGLLYFSFRSMITRVHDNLPETNAPFYELIGRVGGSEPQNDMQVRTVDQALGGPVAHTEVIEPVAEGNHWQWELNPGDVPDYVMKSDMLAGFPRGALLLAHYQTLAEVGLLGL